MVKLKIDNFGPIKHAELDFKKVNILIGQQGAGKSCILKIAAFCMWVEKVYLSGEMEYLQGNMTTRDFVQQFLLEYHKLGDFAAIKENLFSTIFYDSNCIKLFVDFKANDNQWIRIVEIEPIMGRRRVAYLPAERCLASAIPNLMTLKINQKTNIYKYLVDWEDAHKLYSEKNKFDILNLNASYFYDEKSSTDYLTVNDNGLQKNIRFENSASGFHSVVPICILTNYYLNNGNVLSLKETKRVDDLKKLIEYYDKTNKNDIIKILKQNIKHLENDFICSIFLEEPEQNLFPETQYELIKWLISSLINGHDNSLFLATHSPYTLSVFNNIIQASNSSNDSNIAEIQNIMQMKQFVNFDDISVYEVADGKVNDIKDYEMHLIDSNAIDSVSDIINDQFSKLLEYEGN